LAGDYVHDVFVSYRRDPYQDAWLLGEFMPAFSSMVRNEIAATCQRAPNSIFFDRADLSPDTLRYDQRGIDPGQEWQDALRQAIKTSRCVVTLWQPMYFYSDWCQIEWRSFHERAKVTAKRLVLPISLHDGDSFPVDARGLQTERFGEYVLNGAAFRETAKYVEFQERLKVFAQNVALAVKEAPEFSDWPIAQSQAAPLVEIPQGRL
jgi:TIR domain